MSEAPAQRWISQNDDPDLYDIVEEALFKGESSVELEGQQYEIMGSEMSLDGQDAVYMLAKVPSASG